MEVADHEHRISTAETHYLADATLLSPRPTGGRTDPQVPCLCPAKAERIEDEVPVLEHAQIRSKKDRVRLPREGRAEETVVEFGDEPTELGARSERADPGALGDVRNGGHATPGLEPGQ